MKINKEHILLAVIMVIGIAARLLKFDDPDLVMDTVAYSRLGKNLIEYGRYAFGENYNMGVFFPPGYPVLIGLANIFFNDLLFSAKLISFLSGSISILLAYLIGKELYNREAGLFAALLFAVYPVLIIVSVQGYADAAFFCFLLLSIYLFMRSLKRGGTLFHALLGLIFAAATLIRPEGLFLLLLPGARLLGLFGDRLHFDRKYLPKIIMLFLIFAAMVSPYMMFVKSYTGKLSLSGKGNISILLGELSGDRNNHEIINAPDNLYDRVAFTLNDSKTALRGWDRQVNLSMKEYIFKDPLNFVKRYQKNLLQEIHVLMKLFIPFIIPLFFALFSRDLFTEKKKLLFLLYPLMFLLMYPMFLIIEKQTLLAIVFLLIFSSGGFANSQSVISDLSVYYGANNNILINALVKNIKFLIILILIITGLSYLKYSKFEGSDPLPKLDEQKRAGYFLKDRLKPDYEDMNIMGRKPYVSFYSDSRFTMLPYADVSDVVDFARLNKVDYIVIDERSVGKWIFYDKMVEMHKHSDAVTLFYEENIDRPIRVFKLNSSL